MATKFTIKINSILGGQSPGLHTGKENQFSTSINIDPDYPDAYGQVRAAHALSPSPYVDFSGAALDSTPMWMLTNPKNALFYVYCANGKIISYSSVFGSEALVGTATSGNGSGAAYYNNYLYFATPTEISRYGPLNNSPSLANTWWNGTLGLTLLTDTSYPTPVSGMEHHNHAMHVHVDNKLYFCDFKDGQGIIHFIKTKKTTDEGDTDDGSTYNALDLPFGYIPMDIESYGNDLAILATEAGTESVLIQGKSILLLWDTVSDSFYKIIPVPMPFGSALLNKNGKLYVFGGNFNNGIEVVRYLGGYSFKQEAFSDYGVAPYSSAVDAMGQRVVFGGRTTYPASATCVYAIGYKNMESNALHNIINTDAVAGSGSIVSCLKYAQHASSIAPRLIVGWIDASNRGIDKLFTTINEAYFRSLFYTVGKPFKINKVIISFSTGISTNVSITPNIRVDDGNANETQTVINPTNFPNTQKRIVLYPTIQGLNNIQLELRWTGTAQGQVLLPIIIEGETLRERTE